MLIKLFVFDLYKWNTDL